ncbi:archease [Aestuariirhabdus litorea]|uniref:Archease n=1 Tax=Aestuariirhabdus litorea TaxID=2528527 RepID=A0A3P3VJD1_9GAMM|nr:archease [Aestuariirhabdus litorea]RRJ82810.1 archease [Aestuariirhabdus litorea]RWW92969.1 archease [Endozoicomonadaceae bacterium GTF-13]
MARYAFIEEPKGGVGMEIIAEDEESICNAAFAALCLYCWEPESVDEHDSVEIAWYGFDLRTAIVGLLSEALFRMENDQIVFRRFETLAIEEVDDLDDRHRRKQIRISGRAYGEPYDPGKHRRRFPVSAVVLTHLRLKPCNDGLRFYCVLDA